jgi:hypothetical protein
VFQVNSSTAGVQNGQAVAALVGGGSVVVWFTQDLGVFAQRFAGDGSRVGGEMRIDTAIQGYNPSVPKVAALADGGFVVAWQAERPDLSQRLLLMRRFAPNGSVTWSRQDSLRWLQTYDVMSLQSGGFARILEGPVDDAGEDRRVRIERYGADSALVDIQVLDTGPVEQFVAGIVLEDGRRLVNWVHLNGLDVSRMIQFTAADGTVQGPPQRLDSVSGNYLPSRGAALPGGGFVMLDLQGGPGFDGASQSAYRIHAQRFSATATPVGSPIVIDEETDVAALGTTCYMTYKIVTPCPFPWQFGPSVAGLQGGGFVVSWDTPDRQRPGHFIYARQFDAGGLPTGAPSLVSVGGAGTANGAIATSVGNGFAITWIDRDADQSGVFGRTYPGGLHD